MRVPFVESPAEKDPSLELPRPAKYDSLLGLWRHVLFGRALRTENAAHQRLPKWLALPIFSSDALSPNAYATEAILGVLMIKGAGALPFAWPVAIAIALLLGVVVVSYRQIIF